LLQSLIAPRDVDKFASEGLQAVAYGDGTLFHVPGGAVKMTLGAEWRQESALFDSDMAWFDRDRNITSGFAQVRIPLISESMAVPAVDQLSLTVGSRWDRYEDIDEVVRSQVGLQWRPLRSLTVRVSDGRSFRPPSLYELYLPEISTLGRVRDPARNNQLANITVVVGGNDELKPSNASSLTAGVAFAPDSQLNWNVSVDYWRVKMDDRVTALPPPVLLANEAIFSDRVTRAAPTEADIQAGLPGTLLAVDSSRINAGRVEASGVDIVIQNDFLTSIGRFTPELRATWFDKYLTTDIPGRPAIDRVDRASEYGSILKWRAIFSLAWKRGAYGVTTSARYSPAYDDAIAGVRVGREIAAQTLVDLQGSYDFTRTVGPMSPLHGLKLTAGAANIFDSEPSFAEVGGASGFDLSQGDLKQRSYYMRLEKKF